MPVFNDGLAATEAPEAGHVVTTEVLIVGSGPAGSAAALFLSTQGIENIMITKYRWTANTPRAHITNQRTMEILRDAGIEDQVLAEATPHELMGDTVYCESMSGEEIGRRPTWGTRPDRRADYELASPSLPCDIPQTLLEPILVKNATKRGTQTQFSTEYLSHVQDAEGVSVRVRNRLTGHDYTIRAKYLIGADGARSKIAEDIGTPFEGAMDIGGSMNITFKADLAHLAAERPSILYWVFQPGANIGGLGAGLIRCVRPWSEWLIVWGFDINGEEPTLDDDEAIRIVRNMTGIPDLEVEITGYSLWGNNEQWATHMQNGRVFIAGDAAHRHPPSHGLGSNTSVQDAYNLAWKIAAVIHGQAGAELLETYSVERAPVAKQIVQRANQSSRDYKRIFDALGVTGATSNEEYLELLKLRKEPTAEGAARRTELRAALDYKDYEFNAQGTEIGQFYQSTAVVTDGLDRPEMTQDPLLHHQKSTFPGLRLPHAWIGDSRRKYSTHDAATGTGFTLFTGITGAPWAEAAREVALELGIELKSVVIGEGLEVQDLYGDWLHQREVAEDGIVLVRPDKHIAWRAQSLAADPKAALTAALSSILGRGDGSASMPRQEAALSAS
ncbi:FAD-dependent oxidoreductase [Paeniglutamicibacter cryotolerans]|uniref:2,4-dichlorophenol 6-monooxygenase n=1 Tax=Paeniglutamicibacter cryotolerans TaxID=670079 RepID=A0A839QI50_9MICC|nr:FAD-dependent monooxygenase [Paeniglutamicibacter cryotolerans]MBB2995293.1 2,4-dichlorophenol 6-monooxygenase [Paeniglutamicibacter cryotolerans]